AFKARIARQAALAYIDYTGIRDALNRNQREMSIQIGQLFDAVEHQTKGLPSVLSSVHDAGTATIRSHLKSGFAQVGKDIAGLAGKTEEMGADVGRTLGELLDGHSERTSFLIGD